MLIISSSAKGMDLETPAPKGREPHFQKLSAAIQKDVASLDLAELQKLLYTSEKIAILNAERMQNWEDAEARPSIFLYNGDVYKQLHPTEYTQDQLDYAGRSLFAMSGLYGAVGAMDEIKPYRLGMKCKMEKYGQMNDYWRPHITQYFNELVDRDGHTFLLDLASIEYSKAVNHKELKIPVVKAEFKEERDGKLKIIGIMAKRARGMMIDYCIQNQIENPADLRHFNAAGYEFVGEENGTMTFAR
jgi:cytoplasmic iron level regulating protein YaaA (DUF328/UPF0246 family)